MTDASPLCLASWQTLAESAKGPSAHLSDLFARDPGRRESMRIAVAGLTLDYSRQRLCHEQLGRLIELAEEAGVTRQRDAMFAGEVINRTEGRRVLHVALRDGSRSLPSREAGIGESVRTELARMSAFAGALRSGQIKGFSGETITDVVNIGIGGSDLGPRMALEALAHLNSGGPRVHFLSNPDAWATHDLLRILDPRRTLFIVSSKTFTTQETLTNVASARRWLADAGCGEAQWPLHFAAVTAAPGQAACSGYLPERTFLFWDWVGGRYSVWSAIGLPLAIAIGAEAFGDFLAGARRMDEHFLDAPLAENLPVIMALTGIWNRNFLAAPTQLLVSYASRLARFPAFIQQLDMESNGKGTHTDGSTCGIDTGPIVWGGLGIDGQHAYFQLLHQGRHLVPVDFIGVREEDTPLPLATEHRRVVHANLLAQARALAFGRDLAATRKALAAEGLPDEEVIRLAPHRCFPGNVPSNLFWLDDLSPGTLGALIAAYEHKVFVQAAIWGIHAFDQWGVELGKTAVREIYPLMTDSPGSGPNEFPDAPSGEKTGDKTN